MVDFDVNGKAARVDVADDTPLLWVLRDELKLKGTKFGCGVGACGACTVHLNGQMIRACITPVVAVKGQRITTIEGLGGEHPLQKAWVQHQVPQCGYCQPGQIMAAAALLQANASPTREEIIAHMHGNLCRCGTYPYITAAIEQVAGSRS